MYVIFLKPLEQFSVQSKRKYSRNVSNICSLIFFTLLICPALQDEGVIASLPSIPTEVPLHWWQTKEIRAGVKRNLMKYYFDKPERHFYAPDASCLRGNVLCLDTRKKWVYWKNIWGRPKRTSLGKIILRVPANREKRYTPTSIVKRNSIRDRFVTML